MNTNTPSFQGPMEVHSGSNTVLLSWTAPVQPTHARTKRWYIAVGVFAVLCIVFAILTEAWSFLGVFVLGGILYGITHKSEALMKTIAVGRDGFLYGEKFIPWNECSGYWMLQGPDYVELHIERKQRFANTLMIQTGGVPAEDIRRVFSQFLTEFTDRKERVIDTIIRICKL